MNTSISVSTIVEDTQRREARRLLAKTLAVLADQTSDEAELEEAFQHVSDARNVIHKIITGRIRNDIRAIRIEQTSQQFNGQK